MRLKTWPVAALGLGSLLLLIVVSLVASSRKAQEIHTKLDQFNTYHHNLDAKLRRLRSDVNLSGIFVRDDHGIVRRGLRSLLEAADITVVGEAADGLEAVRLCEEHTPDLLIVDIGMPKLNGIEVTACTQKLDRPPGVIILSMHSDESYIIRALTAGARAYLLKDATDEDLLPAVRAVASGRPFFSPAVTAVLVEDYMRTLRTRGLTDSFDLLTDREKEVLQLLAEGRSNKEVATLLELGVSTIETHRANLMQKLNLHNTAEIVLYAVRKGIIV